MFKDYYDNMRPGPTPERVLAICRVVSGGEFTANEIKKICQLKASDPNDNSPTDEAISGSISAATELGFISKKSSGKYYFVKSEDLISNPASFRRAVQNVAFSNKKSTFFKVTEWYISQNEKVFSLNKFEDFSAEVIKAGLNKVSENDILGWRFWMRFLGIAYQYNRTLIPNMNIRLQDVFSTLPTGNRLLATDFVSWIKENVPEAASACNANMLALAVSNGLRTLCQEGKIDIISTPDAIKVGLYPLNGVEMNDFSEIVIKEGIHE